MAISKIVYKEDANATPVVWMDTTDKTADSGNMLNGITALKNDGTTATGNIQSQAAQTIYPSTSDQTITSGKYLTGAQTIKGVLLTNLSAGNIKKDVVVKVGDSADDDRITSVTGTYEGSGGGGTGLVYEAGTWTPTQDIADYIISFTDTHTEAPFAYVISDATVAFSNVTSSNYFLFYFNHHQLFGVAHDVTGNGLNYYGYWYARYRTSATAMSSTGSYVSYPYTDAGDGSTLYPRYWATETGIRAYSNSATRYWRTGRTYKWIAFWTPTP